MKSRQRPRLSRVAKRTLPREREGFTRFELAAVLAVLGLLSLLALPSLANQRERSTRVICVNNLRLVGQGLEQWGTEHSGRLPWRTPWCEGGTMPPNVPGAASCPTGAPPAWIAGGIYNNSWFQWACLTNELRSPNILACPSDTQKTPATLWDNSPSGGFVHPNYQNKAVSYLAGLDVLPEHSQGLVAGDRNVRFNQTATLCSSGIGPVQGLSLGAAGSIGVGAGLHLEAGNYLFTDGRVEELSSRAFESRISAILRTLDDNASHHYLVP